MNLPQMQLLDFYPVEARHIRQLEKGSKAYKQAVGVLKTKLTPTLMNILRHGKDEAAKPFRRKWKSGYLLAILLLAALMLLCVWVSRRQDRPDLAFWLFALVFALGVCLLYYLLTMRTVTAYLCFLLDHYQPRAAGLAGGNAVGRDRNRAVPLPQPTAVRAGRSVRLYPVPCRLPGRKSRQDAGRRY